MQLDDLEAQILRKLEMLSEGSTLNLNPNRVHQSRAGSSLPPGVDEENGESHLRPELSLWAYHRTRLSERAAASDSVRLTAIAEAERDYFTSVKRPPAFIEPDSTQNAEDRDEAILRWEGKRAEWVAVIENCSFSHVRKLRRIHKLHQATGEPLAA